MRIALDAMGGDFAPAAVVKGAVLGARANPDVQIILVGDEAAVRGVPGADISAVANITLLHAPETIGMGEHPVSALRQKPNSSIAQAFRLVAGKKADAVVSAGNTGAMVAGAALSLKLLEGVKRPGIAITAASPYGHCTVIDVGANVECRPLHLVQYAVMATVYHRHVFNVQRPRLGLLSVGSEEHKGNKLTKDTFPLLKDLGGEFVGNVEGADIYEGKCDVVVCDGFVGNVMLKASEGLAETMLAKMRESAEKDIWTRLGLKLLDPVVERMKKWLDFAEYGGAPLLGVEGICIISHGRSDEAAIKNALGAAVRFSQYDVNGHIVGALAETRNIWTRAAENTA